MNQFVSLHQRGHTMPENAQLWSTKATTALASAETSVVEVAAWRASPFLIPASSLRDGVVVSYQLSNTEHATL
jgi:hypothetical protein